MNTNTARPQTRVLPIGDDAIIAGVLTPVAVHQDFPRRTTLVAVPKS
jgi:hypothetical protein